MNNPPSLHTYILTMAWQFLSFWTGKEKVGKRNVEVCVSGWRECVKRSWGGRKRETHSVERGLEQLKSWGGGRSGGDGGEGVMGGVVPHRTCVSVCWNVFYPPALLILTQKLRRGDAWPQHKLTGQRKRGKQECSFKANQLIIVWEEAGHLQEGSSKTHHCHQVKQQFFFFFFFSWKVIANVFWNAWDNNSNR